MTNEGDESQTSGAIKPFQDNFPRKICSANLICSIWRILNHFNAQEDSRLKAQFSPLSPTQLLSLTEPASSTLSNVFFASLTRLIVRRSIPLVFGAASVFGLSTALWRAFQALPLLNIFRLAMTSPAPKIEGQDGI